MLPPVGTIEGTVKHVVFKLKAVWIHWKGMLKSHVSNALAPWPCPVESSFYAMENVDNPHPLRVLSFRLCTKSMHHRTPKLIQSVHLLIFWWCLLCTNVH